MVHNIPCYHFQTHGLRAEGAKAQETHAWRSSPYDWSNQFMIMFSSFNMVKSFHVALWTIMIQWSRWYISIFDGLVNLSAEVSLVPSWCNILSFLCLASKKSKNRKRGYHLSTAHWNGLTTSLRPKQRGGIFWRHVWPFAFLPVILYFSWKNLQLKYGYIFYTASYLLS